MRSSVLDDPRLYPFLCTVDGEFAAAVQAAGCPQCGAVLHSARYPRRIRGIALQGQTTHDYRASFCCSRDGCRRRVTPASVRFLGRKRFLSVVVLLVSAARYGARPRLAQSLQRAYGISRSTLVRWQRWWRETVPQTAFWVEAKTRFTPPVDSSRAPEELVRRFGAAAGMEPLIAAVRFISTLPYELVAVTNVHGNRWSRDARRV
jgi:hypothetical protein